MNIVGLIREQKQKFQERKLVNAIDSLDKLKVEADYSQKIKAIEDQKKAYRETIIGAKKAERENNPFLRGIDELKKRKEKMKKTSIKLKGPEGGGIFG